MKELENWEKMMPRCVFNQMGPCIARVSEACQCVKMPELVYLEAKRRVEGGHEN